MRPQRLRLSGFGAYPGAEEVDFDSLAELGLFAVTGPTGAGKTTLFDAMGFALYGELPAGRPVAEVRSHHASASEACAVELTFSVEDRSYRVRRTPEQSRPKRRGTGTTVEPATAELHRLDTDGTEHPMVAGTRPVTDACVELIGLDGGQFERVVLLPQGRFQRFLLADTKERRPLLQKLFGTDLYRRAVEELKQRAVDLRHGVAEVDAEIDRHRRNAKEHLRAVAAGLADDDLDGVEPDDDVDLLWGFWQKLAPGVAETQVAAGRLAEQSAEATRAAEIARALVTGWDQRALLRRRAEGLAQAAEQIDENRVVAAAARQAGPVLRAARDLEQADRKWRRASDAATAAAVELGEHLAAVGMAPGDSPIDPDAADRALGVATAELERTVTIVGRLASARVARDAAVQRVDGLVRRREELAGSLTAAGADRRCLEERLAALEPSAGRAEVLGARVAASTELCARRRRLDSAGDDVDRRRHAFIEAELRLAEVLAAFVAGAAPRLAAALRAGVACPVCGSVDHPQPAVEDPDAADIDVKALERAQQQTARASSALAAATASVEELVTALGADVERSLAELEQAHGALTTEHRGAEAAARELPNVRAGMEQIAHRVEELTTQIAATDLELATARASLEGGTTAVAELEAEVGDTDASQLVALGHRLAAASVAVEHHRRAVSGVVAAEAARERVAASVDEALAASDLVEVETARAAGLPDRELARLDQLIGDHDSAVAEVQGGLAALADTDLPPERPDAEGLEATASDLRGAEARARTRVQDLLTRGSLAQAAILEARRVHDAAVGRRDLLERTTRVAALCDGQGPGKIGLETWVLAGELEQVTEAANVHLARMTSGRFQLLRTDDAGHRAKQAGLDLAVLDSHTGRARPPATLSGGEQFQASLALALGLADVVSAGGVASGRRFEALFVDEGFGSLDPEALDQAVDALHQIHATGRMVGVITHVEAMKQQLPTGIEVRRRTDGRGSTVVQ